MSRWLRLAAVAMMLILTSLLLEVAPVGAKWVRMGNDEVIVDIIHICLNEIEVNVANSAINYLPNSDPAPDELLLIYRGFLDPNNRFPDIPPNELMTSQYLQLGYHPNALIHDLPPPDNAGQSFPAEAEWYVNSKFRWQVSTTAGDKVSVIIKHFINQQEFTLMFVGNFTVLNCTLSDSSNDPNQPNFVDSRVDAYHPWQPVAIYCEDKMVKVYGIDAEANGYFAFAVTQADIDKLGIPKVNTRLASFPSSFGGNIRLYKLKDTGELQINAPGLPPESWKEYVFTWAGCT